MIEPGTVTVPVKKLPPCQNLPLDADVVLPEGLAVPGKKLPPPGTKPLPPWKPPLLGSEVITLGVEEFGAPELPLTVGATVPTPTGKSRRLLFLLPHGFIVVVVIKGVVKLLCWLELCVAVVTVPMVTEAAVDVPAVDWSLAIVTVLSVSIVGDADGKVVE